MMDKPLYRVTAAGLDPRDARLIEIVFRHSQYNRYAYRFVGADSSEPADILIVNTAEAEGLRALARLRTLGSEIPVVAAVPRGAPSSARYAISIDRLTLQLLPILNRVVEVELEGPETRPMTEADGASPIAGPAVSIAAAHAGFAADRDDASPASPVAPAARGTQIPRGAPGSANVDRRAEPGAQAHPPPAGPSSAQPASLPPSLRPPPAGSPLPSGPASPQVGTSTGPARDDPTRPSATVDLPRRRMEAAARQASDRAASSTVGGPSTASSRSPGAPATAPSSNPVATSPRVAASAPPAASPPTAAPPASAPWSAPARPTASPPRAPDGPPAAAPASPAPPVSRAPLAPTGSAAGRAPRVNVLVVDDSPTVRRQLTLAFERMGAACDAVPSAMAGLERMADFRYDLVLVDVVMPEVDGYQLTREIRRRHRGIPVIILTSRASPFDLARGALAGCASYLVKPVTLRKLESAVIKVLRKTLAIDDLTGLLRPISLYPPAASRPDEPERPNVPRR